MPVTPVSPILTLPLINQEVDPTQTDLLAIQRWSVLVPREILGPVPIGKQPPPTIPFTRYTNSFVGTTSAGGILAIPVSGYSYGYIPVISPGDFAGNLSSVSIQLSACTLTSLAVICRDQTGALIVSTRVRVNYIVLGA